jgi:hypothetical protein
MTRNIQDFSQLQKIQGGNLMSEPFFTPNKIMISLLSNAIVKVNVCVWLYWVILSSLRSTEKKNGLYP